MYSNETLVQSSARMYTDKQNTDKKLFTISSAAVNRTNRKIVYVPIRKTQASQGEIIEKLLDFPGMKHIMNTNRRFSYKLAWMMIVTMSFVLCSYQIYDRIRLYARNPIRTDITLLRNSTIQFPSFTVCLSPRNVVPFTNILKKTAERKKLSTLCAVSIYDIVENKTVQQYWSELNVKNYLEHAGAYQGLIFGGIGGNIVNLTETETLLQTGTCMKFSFPGLVPFKGQDLFFGLKTIPLSADFHCFQDNIMIYIHEDAEDIRYSQTASINLKFNDSFKFGMTAKQFKAINSTQKPCNSIEELNECRHRCLNNQFQNGNFCRLPFMTSDLQECSKKDAFLMLSDYLNILSELDFNVECNCTEECKETIYSINIKTIDKQKNLQTAAVFYFEDNVVDMISEYFSYTLVALFCDIGGNLGLFLGLCIPSILELLEVFFVQSGKNFKKLLSKRY